MGGLFSGKSNITMLHTMIFLQWILARLGYLVVGLVGGFGRRIYVYKERVSPTGFGFSLS